MRKYIVKINGIKYKASGSFSFGCFDAVVQVLTNPENGYSDFEAIPGGKRETINLMRFEAINHKKQIGIVAWVYSDN